MREWYFVCKLDDGQTEVQILDAEGGGEVAAVLPLDATELTIEGRRVPEAVVRVAHQVAAAGQYLGVHGEKLDMWGNPQAEPAEAA